MTTVLLKTATLVVNPAFLQEIKDSNPGLWQTVRQIRKACDSDAGSARVSRQLTRLLDSLRDQLSLQFSLEESYGYMTVPEIPSRTLGELAENAQSQHGILYLQLTDLAEQAEELQYRGVEPTQLRQLILKARQFDAEFREHERLESELIERSFHLS